MAGLLAEDEGDPVIVVNGDGRSRVFLICEHAGRAIPRALGDLGLPEAELARHIAWDIGAEGVARCLSTLLDAPLVMQRYSRLVYDCNRARESPAAIPLVSETTEIPGNRDLSAEQRQARYDALYAPFHATVRKMLQARADPAIFCVHSFTPVFKGVRRELDFGVLTDTDSRFADALLDAARGMADIATRRNEPYGPWDGSFHTAGLHAAPRGLLNVMIEIRNDHIAEAAGQDLWAQRLGEMIGDVALLERSGAELIAQEIG